jgi:hypothetical protein
LSYLLIDYSGRYYVNNNNNRCENDSDSDDDDDDGVVVMIIRIHYFSERIMKHTESHQKKSINDT